ncbi:class I SAM-dependent methyltransferase [Nonomuraea sp. NBC_01738]|uniref:class I SAM-dependent methyltransferase n=1 Tax=Nonomuraea sp. NBC_01738 TaxID=2976003 RepID=UPI002E12A9A0|nr:class I SAM-dependent methyltransferase [Nonomuraea sp. NBC_01738]
MGYDARVAEALAAPLEGWDFTALHGRVVEDPLPWDYRHLLLARLPQTASLLDLGTGGGEFLSALAPLPPRTAATEGYPPNLPVARQRLKPLGVEVSAVGEDDALPYPDGSFALVAGRHESYDPHEVRRVLTGDGLFVTQQVGGRDLEELNHALDAPPLAHRHWDLSHATAALAEAGLTVTWSEEVRVRTTFHDIGALVLFLRLVPWQVPDFDVDHYAPRLRALHEKMARGRPLTAHAHRFILSATSA